MMFLFLLNLVVVYSQIYESKSNYEYIRKRQRKKNT